MLLQLSHFSPLYSPPPCTLPPTCTRAEQPTSLHCGAVWGGGVREGTMSLARLWASFQPLPPLPTSKLGPSGADSWMGGFMYILGPVDLSNKLSCEAGSFSCHCKPHRFSQSEVWGFISLLWSPGLHGLSCSPVVPPSLSVSKCGTDWSTHHDLTQSRSHCLVHPVLQLPSCQESSPP